MQKYLFYLKVFLYIITLDLIVVQRYFRVVKKRKARKERYYEAMRYLQKWDDILISQLYGSVCQILRIKENETARDFIRFMSSRHGDDEILIKKLPLI